MKAVNKRLRSANQTTVTRGRRIREDFRTTSVHSHRPMHEGPHERGIFGRASFVPNVTPWGLIICRKHTSPFGRSRLLKHRSRVNKLSPQRRRIPVKRKTILPSPTTDIEVQPAQATYKIMIELRTMFRSFTEGNHLYPSPEPRNGCQMFGPLCRAKEAGGTSHLKLWRTWVHLYMGEVVRLVKAPILVGFGEE
jgi:hypothetical protein